MLIVNKKNVWFNTKTTKISNNNIQQFHIENFQNKIGSGFWTL